MSLSAIAVMKRRHAEGNPGAIDRDIAAQANPELDSCCGTNEGLGPVFVSLVWRGSHSVYFLRPALSAGTAFPTRP